MIDEVAIYPSALSAAAIEAHFDNGVAAVPATPYATLVGSSNPVGYYRLDEPAAPATTQAATIFAVTTLNNDLQYSVFGNRSNNDERWVGGNYSEVNPGAFRGGRADFSSTYSQMPHTGSHIFAYECSPAAYNFLLNGSLIGTTSGDYNSGVGTNWVVGNNACGNGAQLNGDIAELLIYNRILSTAEANQVGAYLENKYGLDTAYVVSGYGTWADTYAGGGAPNEDYNNDGVQNGIAYFMGATGLATNPGLNAGGTVTWPKSATFSGSWQVQTSSDLATWTDVSGTDNGSSVSYTLPPGLGKQFVRLLVTPTP